jgi:predicted transcriptional regulator YdeE
MDTVIKKTGAFSVLGVQFRINRGSESPELFAAIWKKFETYGEVIESLATGGHYYGISFPTGTGEVTEYLAGMMVARDCSVPEGLEKRTVPGGDYARFECPVEEIGACYQHIFTKWLPGAPVLFNPRSPVFEEYPEKNSRQPVGIHIPVATAGKRAQR